jgi:hypothetical protein
VADFADDFMQRNPNLFDIPPLQLGASPAPAMQFPAPSIDLDPSLMLPPPQPLLGPRVQPGPNLSGGSAASFPNPFQHYGDPEFTRGYGPTVNDVSVNDPSSFQYGSGPLVPTIGADQTGTVTGGVELGEGISLAGTINPQGVMGAQATKSVDLGGDDANKLEFQGNSGSDGSLGGAINLGLDQNDLRAGVNGSYPGPDEWSVGFGVSGVF